MNGEFRIAESTRAVDQSHLARRTFCSWDAAGWRSLLVRAFVSHPEVDDAVNPAIGDQLIVLNRSGSRSVEVRHGTRWRRGQMHPGRMCMTAPGHASRLTWRTTSPEPQQALYVHVPGGLMRRAAAELWDRDPSSTLMPDTLCVTDPLLEQLILSAAGAARSGAGDLYADAVGHMLAVHLLTHHGRFGPPPRVGRDDDTSVNKALEFIHDNVDVHMTLKDIAAAANLSPFHFARKFRDTVGEPPHRYLDQLRVNQATALLKDTNLTLSEISRRCGFRSAASLRAAFRRVTGVPPTSYRRRSE